MMFKRLSTAGANKKLDDALLVARSNKKVVISYSMKYITDIT